MQFESPVTRDGSVRRRGRPSAKTLFAATTILAAGAFAFATGGTLPSIAAPQATKSAPASPQFVPGEHHFSFADLVERVAPAVVTIQVDKTQSLQQPAAMQMQVPPQLREFFRQFDDEEGRSPDGPQFQYRGPNGGNLAPAPRSFRSQAAGSGFIVDGTGYIVTNNHVVDDATKITVKLSDGREFDARLIGADADTDVALLKVDANNLPTVALGDDSHLRVGDWVVAVGNPFGLGGTVTAGIVSSIGRDIGNGPYTDYIQIDAPINRGNSGGPTFDISGRVVGMNTVIYSPTGGSVGIGFAVPSSTIKQVVDELKEHGSISRGWLGVQIQDFTADLASTLGMKDQKGAMVAGVVDGSPAERAGFEQGDIVVALNGTPIGDSKVLTRQVASIRAGEQATFTVLRDGERHTISATIDKRAGERVASANTGIQPGEPTQLGMSLRPLNPSLRQQYEIAPDAGGVVVGAVDPDSEAGRKGLNEGDLIKRVGSESVRSPADVARAVQEARRAGRDSVLLLVQNEQGDRFVALRIAQG